MANRTSRPFIAAALALTLVPSTARAVASGELYHTQSYVYGRFEARIRYAPGDGVVSSFFLWKVGSEVAGTFWNELDFEKLNADCRMQTNPLYGNPVDGDEKFHTDAGDLCGAYHDYRFDWTPTYIAWAIDGREVRREMGAVADAFRQNATSGMRIHFNVWPGNEDFGGNFNPSILPTRQYISWVRYSSFENGTFQQQWQEDFQSGTLPSGWALGDWQSPLGNSTHSPQNVSFVNGIAVLSLTADNATGFSGTPPPDPGAAGGAGGTMGGMGGSMANGGTGNAGRAGGGPVGGSMAGGGTNAGSSAGGSTSGGGTTNGGMPNAGAPAGGGAGSGNPVAGSSSIAGASSGGANAAGGASQSPGGASSAGTPSVGQGGVTAGGGQPSGVGGSSGSTVGGNATSGGAPPSAGASGSPSADADSGCGCRVVAPGRTPVVGGIGLCVVALVQVWRRRRRWRAS